MFTSASLLSMIFMKFCKSLFEQDKLTIYNWLSPSIDFQTEIASFAEVQSSETILAFNILPFTVRTQKKQNDLSFIWWMMNSSNFKNFRKINAFTDCNGEMACFQLLLN